MASPSPHLRVFVIDDDAVMREVLSALLSAEGHEVNTAEDGETALHYLQEDPSPEVILTDMQLPGLSGKALATHLRLAAPQARLLAMSGSQPSTKDRNAFDGFLLKPFTPADFMAAATTLKQPGQAAPTVTAPSADLSEESALDERTYARLVQCLAPAPLAELYHLTLQDVTERLAHMDEALQAGDLDTYRREAHALKGGCSMVGAVELARLAAQAESPESFPHDTPEPGHFRHAVERLRSILTSRFGHVA